MKKQLSCFIVLCGMLNSFISAAQTLSSPLDSIKQKLTTSISDYYKRYPQEKIYIHTNQSDYRSGQTIWFQAYTMAYGKPSLLSKIVYVRLSDNQGKIIKQDKLPVENSTAFGNINVPDSLHTGWYRLQAFTTWMLNFDKDGIYQQPIYIKNSHDRFISATLPESKKTHPHTAGILLINILLTVTVKPGNSHHQNILLLNNTRNPTTAPPYTGTLI